MKYTYCARVSISRVARPVGRFTLRLDKTQTRDHVFRRNLVYHWSLFHRLTQYDFVKQRLWYRCGFGNSQFPKKYCYEPDIACLHLFTYSNVKFCLIASKKVFFGKSFNFTAGNFYMYQPKLIVSIKKFFIFLLEL